MEGEKADFQTPFLGPIREGSPQRFQGIRPLEKLSPQTTLDVIRAPSIQKDKENKELRTVSVDSVSLNQMNDSIYNKSDVSLANIFRNQENTGGQAENNNQGIGGYFQNLRRKLFRGSDVELLNPQSNPSIQEFLLELFNDEYHPFDTTKRLKGETILAEIFKPSDIYVIQPENQNLLIWEFFQFLVTIVYLFYIPIEVFYSVNITIVVAPKKWPNAQWNILSQNDLPRGFFVFLCAVVIIDFLLKFNIGIYRKGILVQNRREIAKQYLRGLFIIDFVALAVILIDLIYWDNITNFFMMLYMLKIANVYNFNKQIIKILQLHYKLRVSYVILRVALLVLFVSNFFACIFYYAGSMSIDGNNTTDSWLRMNWNHNQIMLMSWQEQYMLSFYWAYSTTATVCYGDIIPKNPKEVYVVFVTYMFACLTFAFALDSVMTMLNYQSEQRKRFQDQMRIMNNLMNQKAVNYELQWKIGNYMEYYWKQDQLRDEITERKIYDKLSDSLQTDLIFETNGDIFKKVPIFYQNFSQNFLKEASFYVFEDRLSPNQQVFSVEKDQFEQAFYFIIHGHVESYLELPSAEGISLCEYLNQDYFGTHTFFTGQPRSSKCRTLNYTKFLKIKREDFLNLLVQYPRDHEKFHEIREKIIFGRDLQFANLSCLICKSNKHMALKCPSIQYKPQIKDMVIQNNQKVVQRQKIKRKNRRHTCALTMTGRLAEIQRAFDNRQLSFTNDLTTKIEGGLPRVILEQSNINLSSFDQESFEYESDIDNFSRGKIKSVPFSSIHYEAKYSKNKKQRIGEYGTDEKNDAYRKSSEEGNSVDRDQFSDSEQEKSFSKKFSNEQTPNSYINSVRIEDENLESKDLIRFNRQMRESPEEQIAPSLLLLEKEKTFNMEEPSIIEKEEQTQNIQNNQVPAANELGSLINRLEKLIFSLSVQGSGDHGRLKLQENYLSQIQEETDSRNSQLSEKTHFSFIEEKRNPHILQVRENFNIDEIADFKFFKHKDNHDKIIEYANKFNKHKLKLGKQKPRRNNNNLDKSSLISKSEISVNDQSQD